MSIRIADSEIILRNNTYNFNIAKFEFKGMIVLAIFGNDHDSKNYYNNNNNIDNIDNIDIYFFFSIFIEFGFSFSRTIDSLHLAAGLKLTFWTFR